MKKTDKEKYFYSKEEDKVIVDFVTNDFKKRQQERRPYELAWELNMNFFLGNQYSFISSSGELSDIEKRYYWENREVYNHIAPIIEARLAKLGKVKPNLNIKPASGSENDLYSAKLSKAILTNVIDKNSLGSLISTATYWSEITGTSFYKISWDNSLGDTVGKIDGCNITNGDAVISVCSPFEIYPDSNGTLEIEDCNSIIETRAYSAEYIKSIYNVDVEGEDVDIYELNNNSFLSNISGRSNITKITHSTKHDHVLLIERYEKPTKQFPNGKLTIVCKDKLLYDGDLPYQIGKNNQRTYPFVKQVSIKQVASFWGISVIERCIPIQRAYNSIKNKKHEFIARLASGVLSVEDGSVDVDNLEEEGLAPGKILIYRNGSTPPKFLDPGTIPTDFEKEEDRLLSELNILSSVSDVMTNSTAPSNVSSGTALSLLIAQDETRLSVTAEHIRNAIQKIGKFILRLFKQFATEPRLNSIMDSKGSLEVFYWKGNDLTSDDVILESNNELEESAIDKRALLLSLYDKGLLSDNNGNVSQNTKLKILDSLGFKNWDNFTDINELHKTKASKENLQVLNLGDAIEIDDHDIHINEHTRFLISDESQSIDNEFKQKLIQHIADHKTLKSKQK